MPKGSRQRVQDAVHGLMEFAGLETSVIDVLRFPELQRLRRVRQLGLSYQVYPAAEHSRFAHALGAAYLAIRFCHQLRDATGGFLGPLMRPDPAITRDVALAALLHDLGHGPLSHVWERQVAGFSHADWCNAMDLEQTPALSRLKWHELVGQGLIAWPDGPLHEHLERQEELTSERIRHLLLGTYEVPYLPQILSSDIDVDRCDFVRRDSHMTGVAHGRYDLNWLLSTATVTADGSLFGFDERKAPAVIEQFLVARRALYKTVYRHKTVRSGEGLVGLFLDRLKHWLAGNPRGGPRFPFFPSYRKILLGQPLSPEELLQLDDYSLGVMIDYFQTGSDDDILGDLARRVTSRDLLKEVDAEHDELEAFHRRRGGEEELRAELALQVPEGATGSYIYVEDEDDPLTYFSPLEKRGSKEGSGEIDRNQVFLIHGASAGTLAKEHPELWSLRVSDEKEKPPPRRIFVPREALKRAGEIVRAT